MKGRKARSAKWIAVAVVAWLIGSTPGIAGAQVDASAKAEAKARFIAGQSHYNLNEFAEALVEFKAAYRLLPDPVFLFNSGQCERQLGHLDEAVRFYRNFLREQPKAPNRQEVLHKIDEIEAVLRTKPADSEKTAPAPVVEAPASPPSPQVADKAVDKAFVPPASGTGSVASTASVAPSVVPSVAPSVAGAPSVSAGLTAVPAVPATRQPPHWYNRWWVWTGAAVLAAGVGVAVYAASAGSSAGPGSTLGTKAVF